MSLHHILDHHIFPPRPLPSQRRPTVNQGGGSTGTTTVSTELVARCIRAADPTSTDPSITFTTSDTSLTQLSSLLIRLIRPDANAPTALSNILLSSNTQIEFDVSDDEVQQYSLVRAVYITSTLIMISSSDIFLDGERPGMAAWESASPTVCGHGPSDFEVRGVDDYGLPCQLGIQWEWKREVVLLVFLLKQFWRAAASEDGVVLSLDQNGSPKLEAAGVARLDHHILKWCGQVSRRTDQAESSLAACAHAEPHLRLSWRWTPISQTRSSSLHGTHSSSSTAYLRPTSTSPPSSLAIPMPLTHATPPDLLSSVWHKTGLRSNSSSLSSSPRFTPPYSEATSTSSTAT